MSTEAQEIIKSLQKNTKEVKKDRENQVIIEMGAEICA